MSNSYAEVEKCVGRIISQLNERVENNPNDGVSRYAAKLLAIYNLYFSLDWDDIQQAEERLKGE